MDRNSLVVALLLAAATTARAGADLRELGRELGSAARGAGLRRVAVSRIEPVQGEDKGEGSVLSERLTAALVQSGRVQAVERTYLTKLMEERSLGRSGALEASGSKPTRLARVDGVVTGTYQVRGNRVRVIVRVVDFETGVIVGAADAELEREGGDELASADPLNVPVPVLRGELPGFDQPRDALTDSPARCEDAASRVNAMESRILDLKARYWALRLRKGLLASEVTVNPGSTIPDSSLKARFYETLRFWHDAPRIEPLTPEEVKLFVKVDGEAYALYHDCGL